jgi:hypothetical protein
MTRRQLTSALRARIRAAAGDRCGYCLTRQAYLPWVLEIEHIIPIAKAERTMKTIFGSPATPATCIKAIRPTVVIP